MKLTHLVKDGRKVVSREIYEKEFWALAEAITGVQDTIREMNIDTTDLQVEIVYQTGRIGNRNRQQKHTWTGGVCQPIIRKRMYRIYIMALNSSNVAKTLAHELGHIVEDFVEDKTIQAVGGSEMFADKFAAYCLKMDLPTRSTSLSYLNKQQREARLASDFTIKQDDFKVAMDFMS